MPDAPPIVPAANPYLRGNFAPVADELTAFDLPVTGALPPGLTGTYLRNGPNPLAPPDDHHWFTGAGMLHGVRLEDGHARWYRSRFVRTERLAAARPDLAAAGGAPEPSGRSTGSNTAVLAHHGGVFALSEPATLPHRIGPELASLGRDDFGGALTRLGMNAHPRIDPATGELFALGYGGRPWLRLHHLDAAGQLVAAIDIDLPTPTIVHDLAITARHVLIFDLPLHLDLPRAMRGVPYPIVWRPEAGGRIGVLPRTATDASAIQWVPCPPRFVYHAANAFDDGDAIVVDVVTHASQGLRDRVGPFDGPTPLERWRVEPLAGRTTTVVVDERHTEFPTIDPRRVGRPYRRAYGVALHDVGGPDFRYGGLRGYDLATGAVVTHDEGPGVHFDEGVFVPAHPQAAEDEGHVLAFAWDRARDRSELVVLDASDLAGPAIARVALPTRVPHGFHGAWIPR
ncbi:MAG: carotenoid oxygenase family protein [Deltaproteobacteria bacterium]|nr:carotenoid oxygenase family protein [Deltaproteobacteria bacterium]